MQRRDFEQPRRAPGRLPTGSRELELAAFLGWGKLLQMRDSTNRIETVEWMELHRAGTAKECERILGKWRRAAYIQGCGGPMMRHWETLGDIWKQMSGNNCCSCSQAAAEVAAEWGASGRGRVSGRWRGRGWSTILYESLTRLGRTPAGSGHQLAVDTTAGSGQLPVRGAPRPSTRCRP